MSHGGKRRGAGRPVHAERTQVVRVPISSVNAVKNYVERQTMKMPLYSKKKLSYNFFSETDCMQTYINMSEAITKHPGETFFFRAHDNSMAKAGIHNGDILIVDKRTRVKSGKIVVAYLDNQATVKFLHKSNGGIFLAPANSDHKKIQVKDFNNFYVAGVVTGVIHKFSYA